MVSSQPSIGAMLCAGEDRETPSPPPHVALCLAGHVRTFVNPIVYRSLKENLVDALGVPRIELFAYLKLTDQLGNVERQLTRRSMPSLIQKERSVRHALRSIGFEPQLQADAGRVKLVNSSNPLPRAKCAAYDKQRWSRAVGVSQPNRFKTYAYLQSLLGQLDNRHTCAGMVEQFEIRARRFFDWVIYARPDLVWYRPIRPYCFHNLSITVSHHDWAFTIPRRELLAVLAMPYDDYHGCRADFPMGMLIEHWDVGRWSAHGIGEPAEKRRGRPPIQQNWAGIPAMVMREDFDDKAAFCNHLHVAEQRPFEPSRRVLCRRVMRRNPYNAALRSAAGDGDERRTRTRH